MIAAVVDGQGGGIGGAIIKSLRQNFGNDLEVWGLGANAAAAANMIKAGANRCSSGEHAICWGVSRANVVLGPISIVLPNSMMGEMTPVAAEAVNSSPAEKLLLPLIKDNVTVIGVLDEPLPHLIEMMMDRLKEIMPHV